MLISLKYKDNLIKIAPIIFWIAFLISVYMPFLVYRTNSEYFSETLLSLIAPIIVVVGPFMVCILLILAFIPKKLMPHFSSILTLFAIFLWLQGDLFSISYGLIDGTGIVFYSQELRGMIELFILSVCLLVAILFHKQVNRISPTLILLIFLAQLVIVGFSVITEENQQVKVKQAEQKGVDEEIFAFSSEQNVIVIVLDAFGSEFFQKILQQDENLSRELQGFVSYKDAISQYPQTRSSLVSFLTGKMIPEGVNYSDYLSDTVAKKGLPKYYEDKGFLVSVISTAYTWFNEFYQNRFLYRVPDEGRSVTNTLENMKLLDYSIFRLSPHIFKPHIYNKGFWYFSNYSNGRTQMPDIYPTRSAEMMDYYAANLYVADKTSRFKFLHFVLPHPKFVYDAHCEFKSNIEHSDDAMLQQSKCAIKKLLAIFNVMKNKGVYDNSLIVVMSDHGSRMFKSRDENGMPSEFEIKSSGVLLMVKKKYATGKLIQNDAPVSLIGASKFLRQELRRKSDYIEAENERLFYSYRSNVGFTKNDIPNGVVYQVKPKYENIDNWKVLKTVTNKCNLIEPIGQVSLRKNNKDSYCYSYGFNKYSETVGGLKLIGENGVVVWETKNNPPTDSSYTLKIRVSNWDVINAKIQINRNPLSIKPFVKSGEEKVLKVKLYPSELKDNTKLELYISNHPENSTSSKKTETDMIIIESIKMESDN